MIFLRGEFTVLNHEKIAPLMSGTSIQWKFDGDKEMHLGTVLTSDGCSADRGDRIGALIQPLMARPWEKLARTDCLWAHYRGERIGIFIVSEVFK